MRRIALILTLLVTFTGTLTPPTAAAQESRAMATPITEQWREDLRYFAREFPQ